MIHIAFAVALGLCTLAWILAPRFPQQRFTIRFIAFWAGMAAIAIYNANFREVTESFTTLWLVLVPFGIYFAFTLFEGIAALLYNLTREQVVPDESDTSWVEEFEREHENDPETPEEANARIVASLPRQHLSPMDAWTLPENWREPGQNEKN